MNQKIQEAWEDLITVYPGFSPLERKGGRWTTSGHLPIVDKTGVAWGVYAVDIVLGNNFPLSLPSMWETGGEIERTADWHVYADGSCCVGTEARQYYLLDGNIDLLRWVEQLAIPYLANHKLRILKGAYANGERSHGGKGVYEEYDELFPVRGEIGLIPYMKLLAEWSSVGRNEPCFCGSGKKYKHCFLRDQEGHRKKIPAGTILRDIAALDKK